MPTKISELITKARQGDTDARAYLVMEAGTGNHEARAYLATEAPEPTPETVPEPRTESEAPTGLDAVNAEIAAMMTPAERVDPAEVDSLQASWGRITRTGRGRDFINEWVQSLSSDPDPKFRKKHMVKFAASILATHADEKNGTVAIGMAQWAEETGVFKSGILDARDELLRLRWIQDTGHKSGQKKVFRLTIPKTSG